MIAIGGGNGFMHRETLGVTPLESCHSAESHTIKIETLVDRSSGGDVAFAQGLCVAAFR